MWQQEKHEDPGDITYWTTHRCTDRGGMDGGETRLRDNGTERITIKRLGDDPCQGGSG